ncbi:MAG TPA: site-specific integrase [Candidatus Binatia bacterium]|jgi:integrase
MQCKLTKRTVEAIPAPAGTSTEIIVRDSELPGFGLRVTATGGRIYFAEPRLAGRRRRIRIGRHGVVTADQAREKAKEILAHTLLGEDIASARQQARQCPTVAHLLNTYADRFANSHKKARTIAEDERMAKLHILPALGTTRTSEVTGEDIACLRRAMEKTPIRFNACRALLSHAFNLALRGEHGPLGPGWGITSNPCSYIPKYPTRKKERFLSQDEFSALGKALIAVGTGKRPLRAPVISAIRLLALTGARRDEIRTCRWEWVDFENAYLRLPDSKTGAKAIPLPAAAVTVLKELRAAHPFSKWVIPGKAPGTCLNDLEHPWQRVRKAAGLTDVRLHDLRHSHASTAVVGGIPLRIVGAILGHRNLSTTDRYAHLGVDPVREGVERVGDLIAGRLAAGA